MSRYIDADYFANEIEDIIKTQKYDELVTCEKDFPTVADVLSTVVDELRGKSLNGFEHCPTVDVRPNVHGEWVYNDYWNDYQCSVCGRHVRTDVFEDPTDNHPFCHCGAKMSTRKRGGK